MLETINTVRLWLYQQNKMCVDLQAELAQERQKQATLADRIKDLESDLAAATGTRTGEQEMEQRKLQAHELQGGLAQPSRWLMQGGHSLDDDVLANDQRLETAGSADSFVTALEDNRSSAESVIPSGQQSTAAGLRRTKRKRYN
jgi:hypothetical protein